MKIAKQSESQLILTESAIVPYVVAVLFLLVGVGILIFPSSFEQDIPSWLPILFMGIGFVMIFIVSRRTISIDKGERTISIIDRSVVSKKQEQISIDTIQLVETRKKISTHTNSDGWQTTNVGYVVILLLKDGARVQLNKTVNAKSSSIFSILNKTTPREMKIAQVIADFLEVPYEKKGLPSTSEILSTIRNTVWESIRQNTKEK